jgi:hypothetical protein
MSCGSPWRWRPGWSWQTQESRRCSRSDFKHTLRIHRRPFLQTKCGTVWNSRSGRGGSLPCGHRVGFAGRMAPSRGPSSGKRGCIRQRPSSRRNPTCAVSTIGTSLSCRVSPLGFAVLQLRRFLHGAWPSSGHFCRPQSSPSSRDRRPPTTGVKAALGKQQPRTKDLASRRLRARIAVASRHIGHGARTTRHMRGGGFGWPRLACRNCLLPEASD